MSNTNTIADVVGADIDTLRADLARQTGIAVDLHERLDREANRAAEMEAQANAERDRADAAERARDEVGIQLAAAQAEIARMRRVVDEARELMSTPACERLPAERAVCDALRALDAVPGDALAPKITAALEASGIDAGNVKDGDA